MHPEKIQLDQIQNGRLSATTYFNMQNIWKTMQQKFILTLFSPGMDSKVA